jgi:hypothetical protein
MTQLLWKTSWKLLKKLRIEFSYDLTIVLLGGKRTPEKLKQVHTKSLHKILTA